jgi:hypothetical protein
MPQTSLKRRVNLIRLLPSGRNDCRIMFHENPIGDSDFLFT